MDATPILYVLRDLTPATKTNARLELPPASAGQEWSLAQGVEASAGGRLSLEHGLWTVLQEPWLGLDQRSRCLIQQFQKEADLLRLRLELAETLAARRSFVGLAVPALVHETVEAGYRIRRIIPTVAQVLAFTHAEQGHHLACTFPLAPDRWGAEGASTAEGVFHLPEPRLPCPAGIPWRPSPGPSRVDLQRVG